MRYSGGMKLKVESTRFGQNVFELSVSSFKSAFTVSFENQFRFLASVLNADDLISVAS